jgi:hypothetical protein
MLVDVVGECGGSNGVFFLPNDKRIDLTCLSSALLNPAVIPGPNGENKPPFGL